MWTKIIAALLIYVARGAANGSLHRSRSHTRDASPRSSKAGKKVCLQYGFLNDVVVAGSSTPIGAAGRNGPGACGDGISLPPEDSAVCCTELFSFLQGGIRDDYVNCLSDPANGPVLVENWWLQRDVNNGEIFFEEDAVCARIDSPELDSHTRFELWDDKYLGMPLGLFKKFSVGYDFRSIGGGSGGYLNMYLRTDVGNSVFYDCNFVFEVPNEEGTGTLVIDPDLEGDTRQRAGANANGCPGVGGGKTTIRDYLIANPNAVMGVGNGELYTFVLNTGSSGQDNSGQLLCWSDVVIQRVDAVSGETFLDSYDFTTLPVTE